jgi:hypothetical protein
MKNIIEILNRKEQGIDCTEEQSAEVKIFVKNQILKGGARPDFHNRIANILPLEYSEALGEIKRPTFQSPYQEGKFFVGSEFEIIDTTYAAKPNHPDFSDTYEVRFKDGTTFTALPEEVFTGTGWEPVTTNQ